MYMPSVTTILSVAFLGYMANSMWSIAKLYIPPSCPDGEKICLSSSISESSDLSLILFTTTKMRPSMGKDLKYLETMDVKVGETTTVTTNVKLPKAVVNNGTMYLCIFTVLHQRQQSVSQVQATEISLCWALSFDSIPLSTAAA